MMEGETLKLLHLLSTYHSPEAARPPRSFIGACADDLKALTNLSDIRSKPWVFVSFGPSQKKEPLGGGEPRQD